MSEAVHALSMYFYTSNTPPERARNPHLHIMMQLRVAQLHHDLSGEIEAAVPNGRFLGYILDSTATNCAAIKILQQEVVKHRW
jgi:hypothetical protein